MIFGFHRQSSGWLLLPFIFGGAACNDAARGEQTSLDPAASCTAGACSAAHSSAATATQSAATSTASPPPLNGTQANGTQSNEADSSGPPMDDASGATPGDGTTSTSNSSTQTASTSSALASSDSSGADAELPDDDAGSEPLLGPVDDTRRRIAIARVSGCAVIDHRAYCWGSNSRGQLAMVPNPSAPFANEISGLPPIAGIAHSGAHACALTLDGEVYCWGSNDEMQVGTSNAPDGTCPVYVERPELGAAPCQPTPTRVADISHAVDIAVSNTMSCAVLADGTVHCWGATADVAEWAEGVTDATSISLQEHTACVVTSSGSLDCNFGLPDYAQALRGQRLALGQLNTPLLCVLGTEGSVTCIGENAYGGLGIGRLEPSTTLEPALASGATNVAIGDFVACAVSQDGSVRCWGINDSAEMGSPRFTSPSCSASNCERSPREVEGLPKVVALDTHDGSSCALGADNSIWCWGMYWLSAPERIAGPWEVNGATCSVILDQARQWRQGLTSSSELRCSTASDCVAVPLTLSCDGTCAAVAALRADVDAIEGDHEELEQSMCLRAEELGCATPSATCPSRDHLRASCLSGECVLDDPERTGCTDSCLCEARRVVEPGIAECEGFDLFAWQTATCGTCEGSGIYVNVENRGSEPFSGSAVLDFPSGAAQLPSAKTLNLTIPAGGAAEPIYIESEGAGDAAVRITVNGDCNHENDVWAGVLFPEPGPLCE